VPSSRLDYFPDKGLIRNYRTVFSTEHGKEVLSHILFDLGVFEQVSDGAEDVALKNYGNRLLQILSGGEPTKDNVQRFAMSLMKQPINLKEGVEDE
jgi:hypothetical protein